jgi:bacterioferritin-associated ferredoxin
MNWGIDLAKFILKRSATNPELMSPYVQGLIEDMQAFEEETELDVPSYTVCTGCHTPIPFWEYYMVTERVWKAGRGKGCMHLACLEQRLGRDLREEDFQNNHGERATPANRGAMIMGAVMESIEREADVDTGCGTCNRHARRVLDAIECWHENHQGACIANN